MAEETENVQQSEDAANNAPAWPLVIPLVFKKISANGEEIDKVTLREPTAGDIERVGNPVNIDFMSGDTPKITFNEKAMFQMISTLGAIPPSSIRQMHPRDWNTVAWVLSRFFTPLM